MRRALLLAAPLVGAACSFPDLPNPSALSSALDAGADGTSLADAGLPDAPLDHGGDEITDANLASDHDAAEDAPSSLPDGEGGPDAGGDGPTEASPCDGGLVLTDGICCQPGQSVCGSLCVNEQSDPNNCGGCGLTCLTGCSSGRCMTTLASGQSSPWGIAIDGTNVYWTNYVSNSGGSVNKVLIGGGPVVPLATGQQSPEAIGTDGTYVYWTTFGTTGSDGSVSKISVSGGNPSPLSTGRQTPAAIAVHSPSMAWADAIGGSGNGDVWIYSGSGSPTTLSTASGGGPNSLAMDATNVYLAYGGSINAIKISNGSSTPIVTGQGNIGGIAIDSQYVYYTLYNGGAVMKVSLAGGAPTTLASGLASVDAIAVDSTSVYWTDNSATGSISKVGLNGGAVTPLATSNKPYGIAVDANSVYWTSYGDGKVIKLTPK